MFLPSGAYIIVGLDQFGYKFYNECRTFCQLAGQSDSAETVLQIFHECISQIMHIYSEDPGEFLLSLLSVPNFKLITYTEKEISMELLALFKGQVRIFAINLYNQMAKSIPKQPIESFYTLEAASVTMIGLKRYNVNTDLKV